MLYLSPGGFPACSCQFILFLASGSFLTCMFWLNTQMKTQRRGTFCQSSELSLTASLFFFFPLPCELQIPLSSQISKSISSTQWHCWAHPGFHQPVLWSENSLQLLDWVIMGFTSFPLFQRLLSCHCLLSNIWNCCFCFFPLF